MEAIVQLFGVPYSENPVAYISAEPGTYLDTVDPPQLLLHGIDDHTVPYAESVGYVSKLLSLDIPAQLYSEPGKGHGWFNHPPYLDKTTKLFLEFMDRYLK